MAHAIRHHGKSMSPKDKTIRPPRHELEVMLANGRAYAAWCNKSTREPYENIYMALELAEQAYKAHGLSHKSGLSNLSEHPPSRFTWLCDETTDANRCVKVRDDITGHVVAWPDWP
jgi:hypothetical protein